MRIAMVLGSLAFSMSAQGADAFQEKISSDNLTQIELELTYDGLSPALLLHTKDGREFHAVDMEGTVSWLDEGRPDVPALRRLVAVDPEKSYTVHATFAEPVALTAVMLQPVVSDRLESDPDPVTLAESSSYAEDRELGASGAVIETDSSIGGVRLLGLRLHPVRYNPAKRELTLYRKARIVLSSSDKDADNFNSGSRLTRFQAAQIRHLVANSEAVLAKVDVEQRATVLVVTNNTLLPKARELAQAARLPDVLYEFSTVNSEGALSSTAVKQLITRRYSQGGLDAVLIFGDESAVSLYNWNSSTPGDSWYGLLEGNDNYQDVALGRLPVSNAAEADTVTGRIARFTQLRDQGHLNKRVMLAAHKENYPGKYTGNMEKVRNSANPRGLEFVTQYGGNGATNESVISQINGDQGFGFITYRGHGSDTAWTGWDRNGKSFGKSQIAALENVDEKLAVVISIACSNGAIQKSANSMAEEMLFLRNSALPNHGAVGFLAATVPSYTETNHKFAEHIFRFLQSEEDLGMGNVVALASNQLVRDNGGSMPTNNKMYIYFGDPMVAPWLKPAL